MYVPRKGLEAVVRYTQSDAYEYQGAYIIRRDDLREKLGAAEANAWMQANLTDEMTYQEMAERLERIINAQGAPAVVSQPQS